MIMQHDFAFVILLDVNFKIKMIEKLRKIINKEKTY